VDEQAVDRLERDLGQVLVRAVDRVAGLEADHAPPPALGERGACLRGVERELGELGTGALEHRDSTRQVQRLLRVEPGDAGMGVLRRAEALLGLAPAVVLVRLLDVEHRERAARLVDEPDPVAPRRRVHGQADRQRPRQAGREPHLLDHALVVVAGHEALERR